MNEIEQAIGDIQDAYDLPAIYSAGIAALLQERGYGLKPSEVSAIIKQHGMREITPVTAPRQNHDNLSPEARQILAALDKHVYLATWTMDSLLAHSSEVIEPRTGTGRYSQAMRELLEQDLIEELPDLRCRYQLKEGHDGKDNTKRQNVSRSHDATQTT